MKSICMLLNNAISNDSRVIRVIQTLSSRYSIDLFYINPETTDKLLFNNRVKLFPQKHRINIFTKIIRHTLYYYEFFYFAKKALRNHKVYDYVYCNDLPTLLPAITIKKKTKCKLIYDSHEIYNETLNQFFPTDTNVLKKTIFTVLLRLMKNRGTAFEKKAMPQIDLFITVNNSLAKYFERMYSTTNVQYIMNCPLKTNTNIEQAIDYKTEYGWQNSQILIYYGVLNSGRGLHLLIDTIKQAKGSVKLIIIGYGILKDELIKKVNDYGLTKRVKFLDKISNDLAFNYISGADIGICLLENINLSKQMASPNKLFDYIHSGLPTICSDTTENNSLFDSFPIGVLTKNNSADIINAINKLTDQSYYNLCKEQCKKASEVYNWQNQSQKLLNIFSNAFDE